MIVFSVTSTLALLLLKIFQCPLYGVDDANIFFVYAKNFAGGNGFVYNIGAERVEGFTSFLWVLLCSLAFRISGNPELLLLLVNIALVSLGTTAALSVLPSLISPDPDNPAEPYWHAGFAILLYSMPAFTAWNTIALMDNALWSTAILVTALVIVALQQSHIRRVNGIFSFMIVVLILTRPESFVWIAVFTGILFVVRMRHLGTRIALRSLLSPLLTFTVAASIITVLRFAYFGYPLPNTFYAKVSPSLVYNLTAGARYFLNYFLSNPLVLVCVSAVFYTMLDTVFKVFFNRERTIAGPELLPVIAFTGLAIPILTGGDHFGSFRFYQNCYPILLLNFFYFLRIVLVRYVRFTALFVRGRLILYGVCALVFLAVNFREWRMFKTSSNMAHEFTIAEQGRERGRFMALLFSSLDELPDVGEVVAGGVKYAYPGMVADLMGLNSTVMAHNRGLRKGVKNHAAFEKVTFLTMKPAIVAPEVITRQNWIYNPDTVHNSFANQALKGLFDDGAFQSLYLYGKLYNDEVSTQKALIGWFRRDFLVYLVGVNGLEFTPYQYPGVQ